ncbi:MAG: fimbrillin family protein [Bacteroides sp.]|nr:fimbrillin family protein [Bacteroides sp.]MBD5375011.1 fimbrillin family protein [Bacteroides sp.]
MKIRDFLICGLCSMAVVSCASSDVIDDVLRSEANRIGFETNVSKNSRAMTNGNFNRFFVYASYSISTQPQPVNVFTGDVVTKGTNSWTYSGDRFWVPDATYDFYAYSCENQQMNPNISGHASFSDRVLQLNGFTANAKHQHDLLFASVLNQKRASDGSSTPVAFKFNHLLTRVIFTFKSAYPSGYTVIVSNPRLVNFRDKADFDGKTMEWENVERTSDEIEMNLSLATPTADITSATATTAPIYMIPFAYKKADVTLEFDVQVRKDGKDVLGRTIYATWRPTWSAGHSLNNVITITGGHTGLNSIRFTAEITKDPGADNDGWNGEDGTLNDMVFEAHGN